ncbi:phage tail sheath family protein [Cyanobacteria bacterium FACHB-63]|nr:phage tail sheath family protein [Cyanobacteria bacterium FACHB-63]
MPSTYKTPGVYIEEISKFPPSVAEVATAIPAFIGYTQKAVVNGRDLHNPKVIQPIRITSLLEYEQSFGTAEPEAGITITIEERIDANNNVIERKVTGAIDAAANPPSKHNMYYAMQAYFANGGGPCYVVSVGKMTPPPGVITPSDLQAGIDEIAKEDEVTLFVFPESQGLDDPGRTGVFGKAIDQCILLKDRFAILDVQIPDSGQTINAAADTFRNLSLTLDALKYAAAYTPNVETIFNYVYDDPTDINNQTPAGDLVPVTLVHRQTNPAGVLSNGSFDGQTLSDLAPNKDNPAAGNAILLNLVKAAIDAIPVVLPPSPLVAGQYARVDSSRGVWKAPANVALSSVIKPTIRITEAEQEDLNVHPSGKSVNAIRAFTGKGTLIWGARTLDGNSNEWRYVPVRRFFNMAEESIKKATEQFVFEPNDANTWVKVRAMIENFLILQWRAGALAGAKPEQAFYVSVGLNETMTALDILEGRMIVEIGMAVVRPAEFIILRFSHKMQES